MGEEVSWGLDINDAGQIVGSSGLFDPFPEDGPALNTLLCPCHGFIWENGHATFLDALVEPGWNLILAIHINDDGEIIARGRQNGGALQTVMLEPISKGGSTSPGFANLNTASNNMLEQTGSRIYRDRNGQLEIVP